MIEPQQADFVPVKDQTYTLPWRYLSAAEHRVELRDQAELVARLLVQGVDYTISPQGDTPVGSGVLTLLATPTTSEVKLVVAHDTTPDQNYHAVPGAEAIEIQLDRFSHKIQQLDERLVGNLSLVDRARRWAIEEDGTLVDDEDFSSKAYAGQSKAARNTAINAAEATAVDLFVDTYAEAEAALPGLSEGDVVDIGADETRGNYRTRYRVESAALVFKIRLEPYRVYDSVQEWLLSDEPSRGLNEIWEVKGGFRFIEAPDNANDGRFIENLEGVKLYPQKLSGQWHLSSFGAVQDGVTVDDGAWARLLAMLAVDPARVIVSGMSLVNSALFYQTSGSAAGLDLFGVIPGTCGIIGDFTGDYVIGVDGSSLLSNRFQRGGGLANLTIKAASGAAIKRGLQTVGWWGAYLSNVTFGVQSDDSQGFTEHGIYVPLRTDISTNPDFYASVNWVLDRVRVYNCGGSGIKGDNNTGYAGWYLNGCTFEQNAVDGIEVHTNQWRVIGGSFSYNGRFGINYSGVSGVTLTSGYFSGNELDGNAEANVFVERVQSGIFLNPRMISRVLNSVETALDHFRISNAQVSVNVDVINPYHRIESGMTSQVTLYDAGTGPTANISGWQIEGYRILDSGAGGYVLATAGLTDLRFKNEVFDYQGEIQIAAPKRLAWQSYTSELITTTSTVWKFGTAIRALGWQSIYNSGTGVFTMPYSGAFLLALNATISAPGDAERIQLFLYKNGITTLRAWEWRWPSGSEPDRINISLSEIVQLSKGETFELRVNSSTGSLALFDLGSLSLTGLA